jgi:hypothetical protein
LTASATNTRAAATPTVRIDARSARITRYAVATTAPSDTGNAATHTRRATQTIGPDRVPIAATATAGTEPTCRTCAAVVVGANAIRTQCATTATAAAQASGATRLRISRRRLTTETVAKDEVVASAPAQGVRAAAACAACISTYGVVGASTAAAAAIAKNQVIQTTAQQRVRTATCGTPCTTAAIYTTVTAATTTTQIAEHEIACAGAHCGA